MTVVLDRPPLRLDIKGQPGDRSQAGAFTVIGLAAAKLYETHGEEGNALYSRMFDRVIGCGSYERALAIINEYVRLVDTSGLYPQYPILPPASWVDVEDAARVCGLRVEDDGTTVSFWGRVDNVREETFTKDEAPDGLGFRRAVAWIRRLLIGYSLIAPREAGALARGLGITAIDE